MSGFDFAFQHIGLDRAEALRAQPWRLDSLWENAQVLVLNERGEACCYLDQHAFYPAELVSFKRPEHATFLGVLDQQAYFAIPSEALRHKPSAIVNIRAAASAWNALHATIFAQAKALLHWQAQSKFCGRCGGLFDMKSAGYTASCGACELVTYPQTHPAVIMCVSDGEHILLGRQAVWPEKRWSVLAGFVEPGETPEQTVVREVKEEAGVDVERVQYVKSQPWPMPMALMLGFNAYATYQPITLSDELQDARWFSADELLALVQQGELALPDKLSISHHLIQAWLSNHNRLR